MTQVVVLQHAAPEGPGAIGAALNRLGISLRLVRIDRGAEIPQSLDGVAGLVIMGGPMGVYEADRYPHLSLELRLIEQALRLEMPVLGVCLGSQLLAAALGARVYSSGRQEIGWHEIRLREGAQSDPLWKGMEERFTAFHWHGDLFDPPRSSVALASSQMTDLQAFRSGTSAYGMLFHLEVDGPQVRDMVATFQGELEALKIPSDPILQGIHRFAPEVGRIGAEVFDRWARLVAKSR